MSLLARRIVPASSPSPPLLPCSLFFFVPSRSHTGYIDFQGRFGPGQLNPKNKYLNQVRQVNLQPVKRITFKLNPFSADCRGLRNVMYTMSCRKVRETNPKCIVRTEIRSDGGEQILRVEMNDELDAKPIVFKAGTLTGLEMLYEMNKMLLPLVKVKDEAPTVSTKAGKKKL